MSDLSSAVAVDRASLASHYKEVEAFQAARVKSIRRLSKVMMMVTGVAILANLAQAWTIAGLLPLSHIVPVYLWVRQDGTVDSSIALSSLPPTQSKAVINAALWEYVRLRESYSYDTARYNYDVVSAFSSPSVRDQYQQFFNYPNPESPQTKIGKRGTLFISHISSSDISAGVQQIRFRRVLTVEGQSAPATTWTATITYTMAANLPAALRLTNPGGLVVTSYQAAQDSVQ